MTFQGRRIVYPHEGVYTPKKPWTMPRTGKCRGCNRMLRFPRLAHVFRGYPHDGVYTPKKPWMAHVFRGYLLLSLTVFLACQSLPAQILRFNRANSGFLDNYVSRIILFNGLPVVCTESGLTMVQPDRLETWRRGESGLPDAGITCAAVFLGKIWVGTNGRGLVRLEEGKWRSLTAADSGLADNFVTALTVQGDRLYVGTREGLSSFDGLLWEKVSLDAEKSFFISALTIDGGTLWIGTTRGVFKADLGMTPIPIELGAGLPVRVTALQAAGGMIYIGHEGGVIGIKPDGQRIFWSPERFGGARVNDLTLFETGAYCATGNGLYRLRVDGTSVLLDLKGATEVGHSGISALVRSVGFLWIGLEGGGIARLSEPLADAPKASAVPQTPASSPLPLSTAINPLPPLTTKVSEVRVFLPIDEEPAKSAPSMTGVQSENVQSQPEVSKTNLNQPPHQPPSSIPGCGVVQTPSGNTGLFPAPRVSAFSQSSSIEPTSTNGSTVSVTALIPGWRNVGNLPGGSSSENFQPAVINQPSAEFPKPVIPGWGIVSSLPPSPLPNKEITFSRAILPIIQEKCISCHTTGPGNYFPLSDPQNVIAYFRREGMKRFDQAAGPGRGMFGKGAQADVELLRAWVAGGAKE